MDGVRFEPFAREFASAAGALFSLDELVAPVGVEDPECVGFELLEEVSSLGAAYVTMKNFLQGHLTEGGQDKAFAIQSYETLALRDNAWGQSISAKGYLADFRTIADYLERRGSVLQGSAEEMSRAIFRALASHAVKTGIPIVFDAEKIGEEEQLVIDRLRAINVPEQSDVALVAQNG